MYRGVFSQFEIVEQWIKFADEQSYSPMHCVGTSEEDLDERRVTKKCRGVVQRVKVRGAGTGTIKEKLHIPYAIYKKLYGMERTGLVTGVTAYGQNSVHPEFSLTQKVIDEDGEILLKAFPRCMVQGGPKIPIENGAEEVVETEIDFDILPDDYGEAKYEALDEGLDATVKASWLENFTPALVRGGTITNGETTQGSTITNGETTQGGGN